jgi:hypothetical protein
MNTINNICNIQKKFYQKKGSPATIFITNDNKIIKSIPVNKNREYSIIKSIYNKIQNYELKQLFVNIIQIKKCDKYNYYLLEKYKGDIDSFFLLSINSNYKKNLLFQCLLAIIFMNHELKVYHNDLYYKTSIRNVMYDNLETPIHLEYKNIKITCKKYLCKIIDFGWVSRKPGFRTTEYHEKYFKTNKIISEVLLFSFFYLQTINKSNNRSNNKSNNKFTQYIISILNKMSNLIEKLLESHNLLTPLNFDIAFFNLFYDFYDKI